MGIENPTHLGDGAYATFDGHGVLLTANHHDPVQATDRVYLEPQVLEALLQWVEQLKKENAG